MKAREHVVRLKIPATSANLGAGFDSFGFAIQMYNYFTICYPRDAYSISCAGFQCDDMHDSDTNLLIQSYERACQKRSWPKNRFALSGDNVIPPNGGLGSSATAVVAGCILAHTIHRKSVNKQSVLEDALTIEKHPDNIGAALYGGFTIGTTFDNGTPHIFKNAIPEDLKCFIIYPQCSSVTTELSRQKLPDSIQRKDVVFSLSNAALFTAAFLKKDYRLFFEAMRDKIHEPYRIDPACKYDELKKKFSRDEFYGFAVSGSGPSVIILCSSISENMKNIAHNHFDALHIPCNLFCVDPDNEGTVVTVNGKRLFLE